MVAKRIFLDLALAATVVEEAGEQAELRAAPVFVMSARQVAGDRVRDLDYDVFEAPCVPTYCMCCVEDLAGRGAAPAQDHDPQVDVRPFV